MSFMPRAWRCHGSTGAPRPTASTPSTSNAPFGIQNSRARSSNRPYGRKLPTSGLSGPGTHTRRNLAGRCTQIVEPGKLLGTPDFRRSARQFRDHPSADDCAERRARAGTAVLSARILFRSRIDGEQKKLSLERKLYLSHQSKIAI